MVELLLLCLDLQLLLPRLHILLQCLQLLLVVECVLAHLLDSQLQLGDPLILEVVAGVLLIESSDQLSQLLLLPLHVDVVCLQVLILLFSEHIVQLPIQSGDHVIHLHVGSLQVSPPLSLQNT